MSEKQKKPVMTQEENDRMMNRLMLAFITAVCAVTVVMSLKNAFNTIVIYETVAPVTACVCFVLFILSVLFFALRKTRKTEDKTLVITKYNVLGCGITALLCGLVYSVNPGIASVYSVVMIIGACALYFIYYIYPVMFFALSCFCLIEGMLIHAGFGLSTVRAFSSVLQILFRVGAIVLPVVFIIGMLAAVKKKSIPTEEMNLVPIIICAAAAFIGAGLLMFNQIIYISYVYILYAFAAIYLTVGIVQTVKSI